MDTESCSLGTDENDIPVFEPERCPFIRRRIRVISDVLWRLAGRGTGSDSAGAADINVVAEESGEPPDGESRIVSHS